MALIAFNQPKKPREITQKLGLKLAFLFDAHFREVSLDPPDLASLRSLYDELFQSFMSGRESPGNANDKLHMHTL